jgi:isoquinoline 1-oxidoreductase beta subunit
VHTTLSGGAFGRRLMFDFVVEAVRLSKAAGAPVQVVWTREDDMTHDYYRPASLHRLAAGLDADGRLVAWTHRVVAPSITAQNFPDEKAEEPDLVDGAAQLPYAIPNLTVEAVQVDTPVPVGWWRSVYNTQNAFANEAFLDEIAAALHADPLELRLRLLPEASRLRRPLETAARRAGWGTPAPAGRFRGLACHTCFGSSVAEVAEVSVDERGQVRVHRVVAGLDCGPCVHPDCTAAQVEGAVALGLSAVLSGEITLAGGRVQQTSFDTYPMLDFRTMPDVEAHLVPSAEAVGGVGEPGLPPLAPAVCNAVFAATGRRVRRLPIRPQELRRT